MEKIIFKVLYINTEHDMILQYINLCCIKISATQSEPNYTLVFKLSYSTDSLQIHCEFNGQAMAQHT